MRELIVLQRDQRRDDDRRSAEHEPGELVDGGLAAARRQDGEHIAPRDRGRDSAQLAGPQVLETESRAGELDDRVVVDSCRSFSNRTWKWSRNARGGAAHARNSRTWFALTAHE